MADKKKDNNDKPQFVPKPSDADLKRARSWFERAKTVAETRNYDYAIECYINGLNVWPEAVDEGHGPLRLVSMQRRQAGGKKPGAMEKMKFPVTGKDAKKAMLNAERLLAKDPTNVEFLQAVLKNAGKAGCIETAFWIGPTFLDACLHEKKASVARFQTIRGVFEELSATAEANEDIGTALKAREAALRALEYARRITPNDMGLAEQVRDVSSGVALLKGNYERAKSFRESMADADAQNEIQDKERLVQSEERLDEMIARARADMEANPGEAAKVFALADVMVKQENVAYETEAIKLLKKQYAESSNYQFKRRADEIRMKQLHREARVIVKKGDKQAAQEHLLKTLAFEIDVFKEQAKNYPTDLRIKYELAKRLMRGSKFDEAIPMFQESRGDPKYRVLSNINIGRCFYEKKYYPQAINTFQQVIDDYEITGDDVSKEVHYWLGRSYEAADQLKEAGEAYGQVIQWDYNYKDVRERLDKLAVDE